MPSSGASMCNISVTALTTVQVRRGIADLDQDVIAIDLDGEAGDARRGIIDAGASREIILPSVQRADHASAVNVAGAERSTKMAAGVIDCIEGAAGIEQSDLPAARFDDNRAAVGNVADVRDFDCFGHRQAFPPEAVDPHVVY